MYTLCTRKSYHLLSVIYSTYCFDYSFVHVPSEHAVVMTSSGPPYQQPTGTCHFPHSLPQSKELPLFYIQHSPLHIQAHLISAAPRLTTTTMSVLTYTLWVGGEERAGRAEQLPIEDPATGETIAHCHSASSDDVDDTVQLAHKTFKSGVWSKAPRHVRADVLDKISELLVANLPRLIDLEVWQTGRAIREMKAQVPTLVKWFKYYAALIRTEERSVLPTVGKLHNWIERKPLGVVVQITPFNHPMLIAVKKIAPALAAGNSIVLKPSELTPLTSIELGRLLKEAGLPDGVFSVLPGLGATTGKALVEHRLVKKVDVTGGTPAGRAIGAIAGRNLAHFTAELGGKAPLIIFEQANIDLAVNGVVFGSFIASGQTCVAATRIIVQNKILDQVLDSLHKKAVSIERRMGSPKNIESMMGPLISAKQLVNVRTLVDDAVEAGIKVVTGGRRLTNTSSLDGTDFSKGYFYPPTILADSNATKIVDTRIWKEEAFGPVIVVVGFETEEEALALANDSEFGLGAAIWTQDLAQAFRVSEDIEAGICWGKISVV
ncbi:betaine aldehyde dehydrogenase [Dendryphion nanum]|uniref:aldehyde dehydrogenase (NAD(+)) n=1 Tax=Dendryphion nanum TaxID=256645 RepID=A0A9P9DC56_9PLEO|nr:betaine aldehyde dehydrogenase [Dendryphion nanum]